MIANVLIVYVVAQVLAERKQNQERLEARDLLAAARRSLSRGYIFVVT